MSPPSQTADTFSRPDDALSSEPASRLTEKTEEAIEEAHKALQEGGEFLASKGRPGANASRRPDDRDDSVTDEPPAAVAGSGSLVQETAKKTEIEESVPWTVPSKGKEIAPVHVHDPMESSTATLKPEAPSAKSALEQNLSAVGRPYNDPTPQTPYSSQPPSRSTSNATSSSKFRRKIDASERSPTRSDAGFDEKASASGDERENSRSEIQTIMDQFGEGAQGPGHEEVMSPRLDIAGPLIGSPVQHPPRTSSLEPMGTTSTDVEQKMEDLRISPGSPPDQRTRETADVGPAVPPKPGSIPIPGQPRAGDDRYQTVDSPQSPLPLHRPPPPEPEPEPDLPFDFHRFLEQLRHRTADPVAKFLRSFLQEFGKKQWMVHEQVKIIGDFLAFITNKMAQCEVWREVSDAEFDNAREGMEKLVMNRLYTQTFSPAIPPPQPIPGSKSKRRGGERPMGPGRKGQHQEDVERDEILAQKVSIYGWIREEHLDIPPVGDSGKRFLVLAQQGESHFQTLK